MPITAKNEINQFIALKEAPGLWRDAGPVEGYWFLGGSVIVGDEKARWIGPFPDASSAAMAKYEAENPPVTKPFNVINQELSDIFGL